MSKPRCDSVLKTLPEEQQELIAGWCALDGLVSAVSRCLSELGLKTNKSSLGEFANWYRLRQIFSQADSNAQAAEEMLREQFPEATPEKIAAAGQLVFTMQAANAGDAETFRQMESLRLAKETALFNAQMERTKVAQKDRALAQKDQELALARERFEMEAAEKMLSAAMRARADEINASGMCNADKIAAMRAAAFAEIDELQASGKVVIPK